MLQHFSPNPKVKDGRWPCILNSCQEFYDRFEDLHMHIRVHHCTPLQEFSQIAYLIPCSDGTQEQVRIRLAHPDDAEFTNPVPNNPDARPKLDPPTGELRQPVFDKRISIETRHVTREQLKSVLVSRVDRSTGDSSLPDLEDICVPFRDQPPAVPITGRVRTYHRRQPPMHASRAGPMPPPKPKARSSAQPGPASQKPGDAAHVRAERAARNRLQIPPQLSAAPRHAYMVRPPPLPQPRVLRHAAVRPGSPYGLHAQQSGMRQSGTRGMQPAPPLGRPAAQHYSQVKPAEQYPTGQPPPEFTYASPRFDASWHQQSLGAQHQAPPQRTSWHQNPVQAEQAGHLFDRQQPPALAPSHQIYSGPGPLHGAAPSNSWHPGQPARQYSSHVFPPTYAGPHPNLDMQAPQQPVYAWQPGSAQAMRAAPHFSTQNSATYANQDISLGTSAAQPFQGALSNNAWQPVAPQAGLGPQQFTHDNPPVFGNQGMAHGAPASHLHQGPQSTNAWQAGPSQADPYGQALQQSSPSHVYKSRPCLSVHRLPSSCRRCNPAGSSWLKVPKQGKLHSTAAGRTLLRLPSSAWTMDRRLLSHCQKCPQANLGILHMLSLRSNSSASQQQALPILTMLDIPGSPNTSQPAILGIPCSIKLAIPISEPMFGSAPAPAAANLDPSYAVEAPQQSLAPPSSESWYLDDELELFAPSNGNSPGADWDPSQFVSAPPQHHDTPPCDDWLVGPFQDGAAAQPVQQFCTASCSARLFIPGKTRP